jgi:hypothetical protein
MPNPHCRHVVPGSCLFVSCGDEQGANRTLVQKEGNPPLRWLEGFTYQYVDSFAA